MLNNQPRMAENYEIISAFPIGDKEVVFGRDIFCDKPYFCGLYSKENIICYTRERYEDCFVSDDYVAMMEMFADRIKEQCEKVREMWAEVTVPREPITYDMCYKNDYKESIVGKIVAIKESVLRPEFQSADRQLFYVTGGSGAVANSRGSACFAVNLYSGKEVRWERHEIQGEVKPECLPEWAKERAAVVAKEQAEKEKRMKSEAR